MKPLLDYFRLGLAIGEATRNNFDFPDRLLKLERPGPEAQFVVIGALVGQAVEDPWAVLEVLKDGDDGSL
jgi:hypothetical protein